MSESEPNFWLHERYGGYEALIRDPESGEIRLATSEDFERIPALREFKRAAEKAIQESFAVMKQP